MSANTSFATTTSTLTQFIAKQKITNGVITSDLSSTEYPISTNAPLTYLRSDILKSTTLSINQANTSQSGYITNTDWNNFDGKLSSIVSGTNISSTGGINPTVSLSISSGIDMSNQSLTNLSSEDYPTNIDIRQSGISRIYTSGANMILDPLGNLRILSDVSLNGKRLDMSGGSITGISNENYPTNIDIRQNNVQRIYNSGLNGNYTSGVNNNMTLDPIGNLYILSDVSLNGNNLDLVNGKLMRVKDQNFELNVGISQAGVPRIYTNSANMTLDASGYLNITTDVSMNGKSIDMSGGSFKRVNYTDMSLNGNTIDMSGGAIIRVGNQNFQTNIDIKQAGVSRIYTSGANGNMTIDASGNLRILSDLSMNGNAIDMSGGVITGISNSNFPTNIDIRQNNVQRIYTNGASGNMTIDASGNLGIISDVSLNGYTLDMGGTGVITGISNANFPTDVDIRQSGVSRIYTSGTDMTIDPAGKLSILSNVSLNGNTIGMDSGTIIDISELYGLTGNNTLRIDASRVSFTNNTHTRMVIDNCGIILNDISYSNTGSVLSFNTTNNRVHYYPLYESSVIVTYIYSGTGGSNNNFNLKINKVADTVTIHIPATSCTVGGMGTPAFLDFSPVLDAKYRPTSEINFPVIVYTITTISSVITTVYKTGKFKILTDGSMYLYNDINESDSVWVASLTPPDSGVNYIIGQSFTYTL